MYKKIQHKILFSLVWVFALLPAPVLYFISDICFLTMYYLIGYRKKVVLKNLKNAFPEKSEKELVKISKNFFGHLCDFLIESIMPLHLSQKQMNKRMRFTGLDLFEKAYSEGKDVVYIMGHYGNWEWLNSIPAHIPSSMIYLYMPLQSQFSDILMLHLRSKYGGIMVTMKDSIRDIIHYNKEGKLMAICFLGDQRPNKEAKFWTMFLNQETSFYQGAEKIAKKLDAYVVFLDIHKTKRGHYEARFSLITDKPKETEEFEITQHYVRLLETKIKENPYYWLWSHKRWKHKRTADMPIQSFN